MITNKRELAVWLCKKIGRVAQSKTIRFCPHANVNGIDRCLDLETRAVLRPSLVSINAVQRNFAPPRLVSADEHPAFESLVHGHERYSSTRSLRRAESRLLCTSIDLRDDVCRDTGAVALVCVRPCLRVFSTDPTPSYAQPPLRCHKPG